MPQHPCRKELYLYSQRVVDLNRIAYLGNKRYVGITSIPICCSDQALLRGMDFKKLLSELSRRNVLRAVVAYLAVAWVIIQIASIILPTFDAPPAVMKGLVYLLAIGLVFWIAFSWIYDLTPQGLKKTDTELPDTATIELNNRRLNKVIASAVITAVLLLIAASFWAGSQWNDPSVSEQEPRLAVLPLQNQTAEDSEDYFAMGITEAFIKELSKLEKLTVLSLASTRYFEAGIVPQNNIIAVESADVDYFMYGTWEKSGFNLEVNLKISQGLEKDPIWQESYSSDLSNAPQLWSSIVLDVSKVIGLSPEIADRLLEKSVRPVKAETYELYLKGKYYLNKSTVEDWKRGLVYLQEAIDQNPADPYAYAGMAEGYITWGHSLMPPKGVFPKALEAAKRAIQLDSANAEGWAALSQYHTYFGWDWDMADYAYRKANALNPNLAMNHYHRAWYLALFGRMNEAIEAHEKAKQLDPFSSLHTNWLGELYRMVGEYELALEQAEEASKLYDDDALSSVIKGSVYIDQGRVEEGLEIMRQAVAINSGWKYLMYGPALLKAGKREEGLKIIKEAEGFPESPYFSLCLAAMYHADGNLDKTFEWLDKAKGHAFYAWFVRIFLADEKTQADPRHLALLQQLNLPPPAPLEYDPSI